jgi:hypothetical protein
MTTDSRSPYTKAHRFVQEREVGVDADRFNHILHLFWMPISEALMRQDVQNEVPVSSPEYLLQEQMRMRCELT